MLAALRTFMAREGLPSASTWSTSTPARTPAWSSASTSWCRCCSARTGGPELCHYFLDEAALRRHLGLAQPA
jgi:hypothetical protein